MKIQQSHRWLLLSTLLAAAFPSLALSETTRGLVLRSVERDGANHIRVRAAAFESEMEKKFPLTTFDKNAFQLVLDGELLQKNHFSLTTFASTRRWNSRATMWIYDATAVKSMPGLTRELRTLVAQEFPSFNSDFLSVVGVAGGKSIERVLLDNAHQENVLALQRSLIAEPVNIKPESVFREHPICVAANRFASWQKIGLKASDQKNLILLGGSPPLSRTERNKAHECATALAEMQVTVHQVVFARAELLTQRQWLTLSDMLAQGTTYRVVDMPGASRAIQNLRTTFESEYVLTAELPPLYAQKAEKLVLQAIYHNKILKSAAMRIPKAEMTPVHRTPGAEAGKLFAPPQRMNAITNYSALAFDAWLEWLLTSFIVGFIVTIRHMNRLNSGITVTVARDFEESDGQSPRLIVLNGRERGKEFRIRQDSTLLGKGWGCDVRLASEGVKRKHGRLQIQGDKAVLHDLSEGHLFVNGRPIRSLRVIGHGSVIRVGALQLLFQCGDS